MPDLPASEIDAAATAGPARTDLPTAGAGPDPADELIVVTTTAPVAGGAALARDRDGRVVFVTGALPGEQVEARVTDRRKDFARAVAIRILEPSADRVTPPCSHVAEGCGGCDLQHAATRAQLELKRAVVVDALRRLGRIADPAVEVLGPLPATGFRTSVRCGVRDGRAGFRQARRHDVLVVDHCLVAHPLVDELVRRGRYGEVDEVTIRVGARSGERLVMGAPTADSIELPPDLVGSAPLVVGADEVAEGRPAWFHEIVAGHAFRISAGSFFQTRPDGAEALVDAVRVAGADELAAARRIVDLYGGVGLFGALVSLPDAEVTLVEANRSAVADAHENLAHRSAQIVRSSVERWRPSPADVVIADPSRAGLGRQAVPALVGTGAGVVVLVSCDAASLGRDARLLAEAGYRLEGSSLVDLFPHTHHVEVVSRFTRA